MVEILFDDIICGMIHHKFERSLVVIKPDGVQRGLIGQIIARYEQVGLKLVAMKMITLSADLVEQHYTLEDNWKVTAGAKSIKSYLDKNETPPESDPLKMGELILTRLKKFMTSGPVIAMVWQGAGAVELIRKITGATEPLTAGVGTIRGDYGLDSYQMTGGDGRCIRNIIHASGTVAEAKQEIKLWFKPEEIIDYRLVSEQILYDVNLDGILE